ncbi:hypothetical protein CN613_25620 [Bacillus pseudomycoides]|uniref:Uncharacterized protein n=1 Tax=Bacillus pseudomycoides TaxID=64104 RepID=A0A2A8BZD0_9BACI|nr:hypothetical protein [Bacillus pseudomycoides]PEM65325.1 hypothetical protein CN613_25620 [Bacillus pseudomycoides]
MLDKDKLNAWIVENEKVLNELAGDNDEKGRDEWSSFLRGGLSAIKKLKEGIEQGKFDAREKF